MKSTSREHTWRAIIDLTASEAVDRSLQAALEPEERCTMFEQVLDSVRKMSESTIQMQQEFYKQWMSHLPTTAMMSPASTGGGVAEQAQSLQKRWMDSVTELMNKQREALDAQYRTGIQAIQDAFRVTEAKSVEEYRQLTEDLWRKTFETLKNTAEAQMRDYQSAVAKWLEMMSKRA